MTAERILTLILFFAMMFGVRQLAHAAVAAGFIPWFLLMVGIFWVGIKIENHDRALEGRLPYSWYDAGRDFKESLPVFRLWIALFLAFLAAFFYVKYLLWPSIFGV
jgi:hypothetical protein